MAIEAGKVLNERYRLIRPIGRGAQASVWVAEHLALSTQVAVKLIDPELAKQEDARSRFKREATAAAKLRSAHVVQILDHGIEDEAGQPFIVMELLDGEDLFQRIERKGRLSARETAKIVNQVARALARAHAANIIHRDLKPENVFLVPNEDDEVAKVLDFGVAKVTDSPKTAMSSTGVGTLIGTPHYMSPEQVKGIGPVDHRTDLWSVGVIAFQCVTGDLPFDSEGVGDLLIKISMGDIPVPSKVVNTLPKAFDTWFAKACAREPDERFSSARELADALVKAVGIRREDGPRIPPLKKPERPIPPPRKSASKRAQTLQDSDLVDDKGKIAAPDSLDDGWDFDEPGEVEVDLASRPPGPSDAEDDADVASPDAPDAEPISSAPKASAPSDELAASAALRAAAASLRETLPADAGAEDDSLSDDDVSADDEAPPSAQSTAEKPAPPPRPQPKPSPESPPARVPAASASTQAVREARSRQQTVSGLSSSDTSIPPPPELDPSRRRRVLGWVAAGFVLLAGYVVWSVVQSQPPTDDASPAAYEAPERTATMLPPPDPLPPPPEATPVDIDAGEAQDPGAATKPSASPNAPPPPRPGGPFKKKNPDEDLIIEIPLPEREVPTGPVPPAP